MNVSAEKEKLAHLRAEAAESKATEQEERVQALSQEVKETREQISKLESATIENTRTQIARRRSPTVAEGDT